MKTALLATMLLCGYHLLKMKSNNMHHIFPSSSSDDIFKAFLFIFVFTYTNDTINVCNFLIRSIIYAESSKGGQ